MSISKLFGPTPVVGRTQISRVTAAVGRSLPVSVTLLLLLAALANYAGEVLGVLPGWLARFLDGLSNFSAVFLGIFIEAAPFLLLGALASGVVEVFIQREDLLRWIPRSPLGGALAGSLFGLFFPVCECGVVPFARRLMQKGLPVSVGVATLLAAPILNPIVIASTLAAFGPGPIFWGRMGLALVIATATGLIFSLSGGGQSLLRESAQPAVAPQPAPVVLAPLPLENRPSFVVRLHKVMLLAVDEFFEMGRYLILGALLAALLQTVVRQSDLLAVGQGPVLSVVAMTGLAVLLSICSTVDAFIALAFAGLSFTGGSVLAFLVFGPMVDIKSTLMFLRVFKPRTVLYLVLLPLLLTLIATIFINYFIPGWSF